jgi:hypothetical protein
MAGFNWRHQSWLKKMERRGHEPNNAHSKPKRKRRYRKSPPVDVVVVTKPRKPIQPHADHAFSRLSPSNPRDQLVGVAMTQPPWVGRSRFSTWR